MGKATDKQVFYLKSKNIDASNMDYETASKLIGQFKNQSNPQPGPALNQPMVQPAWNDKPKFDTSSYYVAYAKDIVVALIDKIDLKEGTNVDATIELLMKTAIKSIQDAKQSFM